VTKESERVVAGERAAVVVVVAKESERVVAGDFVDVVGDKDFFVQGERRRAENEVGAKVVEDVGRRRGVVVERAGNVVL
jgi:hypothetical protein